MEIEGRLIQILPLETGTGKNGDWRKQDIILEIKGGEYPKKLCISLWGDKINSSLIEGSMLKVSFDVESREYKKDKWYTNAKAWRIEVVDSLSVADPFPLQDEGKGKDIFGEDDLPF